MPAPSKAPSKTRAKPPAKRRARSAPHPRSAHRNFKRNRKSIGRKARKIAGRRGKAMGLISLTIAATAFTIALAGAASEIAAWELGLATDGLGFGVAWIVGDLRKPPDQSHLKRTAAAAKARAAVCGAPTVDGTSCKNRGRCPHHKGGAGQSKSKPQPTAPGAPKPASNPGPARQPRQTQRGSRKGVPGTQRAAVNPGHPGSKHPTQMP